ncbi:MAG: prepilin-type N-terminal cleavage/methylation domain-containing protein [Verrucomicrobia bacterium]|jgi:prepilin-type N-terminal cleavage/methylation domain-containing protein|nr:prepilin-type N-terminal cleavage/methylation domain-containing protein [Verrucomicrobiota bacterium]MBT7065483.1 prepilin-type N-terminal cleavage/methylation domain-containing protein [Verrucomicrobiota bacterium]MBT7699367.1 prepilin-type N-terminal cleavage/methylation domain-containing protein [Verrucomicrobiota bacterium]
MTFNSQSPIFDGSASAGERRSACGRDRRGFTLLEVLVAVTILSVITGISLMAFQVVSVAWRKGMLLSDDLHHGDFVVDQLVLGLRSAYVPDSAAGQEKYGFWIEDNGDDAHASDVVSWVKLGAALVGRDSRDLENPEAPHRVEFFVGDDETGEAAAAVRAWSLLGQAEEFESDDVEPRFIARRIVGFNCRMQDPEADTEEAIEWIDEWDDTNRLPYAVEVTLWMEPIEEDEEPIELKRIVQIPLAPLSWGRNPSPVARRPAGASSSAARGARRRGDASASRARRSSGGARRSSSGAGRPSGRDGTRDGTPAVGGRR